MTRILAFAGSTRKDSFNRKLIRVAAGAATGAGAEVTLVELSEFEMPLFNQDLESQQGMPETARRLKQMFIEHDGLLIAAPEYNSSITPLMKNTLDWVSRSEKQGEPPLAAYRGKVAAIMSASPGALGGLRGLVVLRMLLSNLGVMVLPEQHAVPGAMNAFNEDGSLVDENMDSAVTAICSKLVSVLERLNR